MVHVVVTVVGQHVAVLNDAEEIGDIRGGNLKWEGDTIGLVSEKGERFMDLSVIYSSHIGVRELGDS